jgi:hypothetical protein
VIHIGRGSSLCDVRERDRRPAIVNDLSPASSLVRAYDPPPFRLLS